MKDTTFRVLATAPLGVGGITSMMINVQKNIDRSKVNFDYLVLHDTHEACVDTVLAMGSRKIVVSGDDIKFKPLRFLVRWVRMFKMFKKERIEVFHINGGPSSDVISVILAKLAGVKHVTFHSHNAGSAVYRNKTNVFLSNLLRPIMPLFIDEFWACSSLAAQFSFPKSIIKDKKYRFIPNGINLNRFSYDPKIREEWRRNLNLSESFVVGHAGRFNKQKNHEFLIDIFAQIHQKRPDAVLLLLGVGELQEEIRKKVCRLHLEENVIFYGATSEIEKLYQVMDVFVMPSFCEGLPVAGVEVQVSGLPLVLADTITREVAVLNEVEYISLDAGADYWADRVIALGEGNMRSDHVAELRNAGFDEKDTAKIFENYYLSVKDKLKK